MEPQYRRPPNLNVRSAEFSPHTDGSTRMADRFERCTTPGSETQTCGNVR